MKNAQPQDLNFIFILVIYPQTLVRSVLQTPITKVPKDRSSDGDQKYLSNTRINAALHLMEQMDGLS